MFQGKWFQDCPGGCGRSIKLSPEEVSQVAALLQKEERLSKSAQRRVERLKLELDYAVRDTLEPDPFG